MVRLLKMTIKNAIFRRQKNMCLKILFYVSSLIFLCPWLAATDAPTPTGVQGKITANILNVRVNPGKTYTVVAKLKINDDVIVLRKQGDWYEIMAPRKSSVWVAAAFVRDGKTTSELKLRSGPSVNHRPYGVAPAGTPLTVLGEKRGDWIKVAPPPFLTAWVGSKFVECDTTALTAGTPQQEPTAEVFASDSVPFKTTNELPQPSSIDSVESNIQNNNEIIPDKNDSPPPLPFVEGTEKKVVLKGTVYPLKDGAVYVTHALVELAEDNINVLCYLHGGGNILKVWEQRNITVTGQQKIVNGWNIPVVVVEKISTDW